MPLGPFLGGCLAPAIAPQPRAAALPGGLENQIVVYAAIGEEHIGGEGGAPEVQAGTRRVIRAIDLKLHRGKKGRKRGRRRHRYSQLDLRRRNLADSIITNRSP